MSQTFSLQPQTPASPEGTQPTQPYKLQPNKKKKSHIIKTQKVNT